MILRNALTVGRYRKFRADLGGDGVMHSFITPWAARKQYLVVIVGEIDHVGPVNRADVVFALRNLLDRVSSL